MEGGPPTYLELPELAKTNTELPIKCEFQIGNESFFSIICWGQIGDRGNPSYLSGSALGPWDHWVDSYHLGPTYTKKLFVYLTFKFN